MPSESSIIARIRRRTGISSDVIVGIGDDAAIVRPYGGQDVVLCCDLCVEQVHFQKKWAAPDWIGYKALSTAISDVGAMGGVPKYALISLAVPSGTSDALIDGLIDGLFEAAGKFAVSIIGGDTSASPGPIVIDASVIGECVRDKAVTRSGARAGDLIFVTGELGASALGLKLLEKGHRLDAERSDNSPLGRARAHAISKHLLPEPPVRFGAAMGEAGAANAMIDISDGLSTDLSHIISESGCGAIVSSELLPIAGSVLLLADEDRQVDSLALALHGGEEYELLFTVPRRAREEAFALSRAQGVAITEIGVIVEGNDLRLARSNQLEPLNPGGYEHLR